MPHGLENIAEMITPTAMHHHSIDARWECDDGHASSNASEDPLEGGLSVCNAHEHVRKIRDTCVELARERGCPQHFHICLGFGQHVLSWAGPPPPTVAVVSHRAAMGMGMAR